MKLFRVLVLAVALVAGGIAALLALNMSGGAPETQVVEIAPQILTQDVLVAAADIRQGQTLTAENIRWQKWPEEALNATYIQRATMPEAATELAGSVVRTPFVAGEPIRNVKLARPESGFLSAILPSGKRAAAVSISAESTAGGFILPNDRVDVIHTTAEASGIDGATRNISHAILTNIKVLAIDQQIDEQDGESVVVGKTATLELDPAQVATLTAAQASGSLSLALRSATDSDEVVTAREDRQSGTVRVFRNGQSYTVSTQ
jgi:pilus assembly protein CpaB